MMSFVDQAKRAQELIKDYNSYQNPEEVISEMAYIIADLEEAVQVNVQQIAHLLDRIEGYRGEITDFQSDLKYMERECQEAYRQGAQDGRDSCDGRYY